MTATMTESPAQQQLQTLLNHLEGLLTTGGSNAEEVASTKAQISDLQKLVGEEGSAENQYAKDYAGIIQEQEYKRGTLAPLAEKIKNLPEIEKQRVARIIAEADTVIARLRQVAKNANDLAIAKATDLTTKSAATKTSQQAVADLKDLLKPFPGILKTAGDAITRTAASVVAGNLATGLFWAGEATTALGQEPVQPAAFNTRLETAITALNKALQEERVAKDKSDKANKAKAEADKALAADAVGKRSQSIVTGINSGAAPVPPPPPAGTETGKSSAAG